MAKSKNAMKVYWGIFLTSVLFFSVLVGLSACSLDMPQPGSEAVGTATSEPLSTREPENEHPGGDVVVVPQGNEVTIGGGASAGDVVIANCTETNPHPFGQSIANTYEVPYNQVMTWFCDGYSFENILVALATSEAVDIPVDTLLEMLLEREWEEIWVEIGFIEN